MKIANGATSCLSRITGEEKKISVFFFSLQMGLNALKDAGELCWCAGRCVGALTSNRFAPRLTFSLSLLLLFVVFESAFIHVDAATEKDNKQAALERDATTLKSAATANQWGQKKRLKAAELSPLQAYLYSPAALTRSVVLQTDSVLAVEDASADAARTDAAPPAAAENGSGTRGSKARAQSMSKSQRRVLPAHDDDDGGGEDTYGLRQAAASSSSSSASAMRGDASLAAMLTGRYVVLSRIASTPLRDTSCGPSAGGTGTFLDAEEDEENQEGAAAKRAGTRVLAGSLSALGVSPHRTETARREKLDGDTDGAAGAPNALSGHASSSSSSSSSFSQKLAHQPRIFPEEALRRLAQEVSSFSNSDGPSYTDAAATAYARPRHPAVKAAAMDEYSPQHRKTARLSSATSAQPSASGALSSELEVHVIDAAHILVYLPPSEASAALLRAMAAEGSDGVTWRAWDVFRSTEGGGPRLKLSSALRRLLDDNDGDSALSGVREPQVSASGRPSTPSLASFAPHADEAAWTSYEVTLWTARGGAAAVHAALTHSARLQRFMWRTDTASALFASNNLTRPSCRLTLMPVDASANAVRVRVDVLQTTATTHRSKGREDESDLAFAERRRKAVLTQRSPSDGSAGAQPEPTSCLRTVLHALAAHPAVRWVEESYRRPELLNIVASKTIQHGHCSTYDAAADTAVDDNAFDAFVDVGGSSSNAPMWSRGFNGTGEIIAVADSGVDTESCFFRDPAEPIAYYPDVNLRHRKVISYHAYVNENGVTDTKDRPEGHGTHVAGTVAGYVPPSSSADTTAGTAVYGGVAPGAKLFVHDMSGDTGGELSLPANLLDIFAAAYDAGARISSNSWGFRDTNAPYLAMEKIIDTTVAEWRNLLVLVAVGNSGRGSLYVPGRTKNVLTVGAHLNSPLAGLMNIVPEKSASGVTYDGRRKPDLVAPGGGAHGKANTVVMSARAAASSQTCATVSHYGTSMATAAAAGAAAIVRQYLREQWHFTDPSSALLRAALLHSTTTMPGEALRQGVGRLDLSRLLPHENRTVERDLPPMQHWFLDDAVVRDGEVQQYCFTLADLSAANQARSIHDKNNDKALDEGLSCSRAASLTVTATLVWNDPGTAVEGSLRSQVHDLDLMLVTQRGYTFFSGPNATTREKNNTIEQIRVPITLDGTCINERSWAVWRHGFRLLVRGEVVRSTAGQPFALAVSGPGLEAVSSYKELLERWQTSSRCRGGTAAAACPMNCSGHGMCDATSQLCKCMANYTSVSCAECDPATLCHGQGTCDTTTMTCTCNPRGHFADAYCSTCQKGWYGPDCASDCTCQNDGVCNTTTGLCACVHDTALQQQQGKGCFQGPQCQYCCDGFRGTACNQRSYWCNTTGAVVVVDDPSGGFIQINGFGVYGYSLTCRWAIRAAPGQQIQLEILSYKIEEYDVLSIYDIVPNTVGPMAGVSLSPTKRKALRKLRGSMEVKLPVITSTAEQLDVEFISDWEGVNEGFLLYYRFTSCSEKCQLTNLTGPIGHWKCGEAFGLPTQQCICEPPYVGWHCNEAASDVGQLSRELAALQISSRRVWQGGRLAWMFPLSTLTAAEVRLPVQLTSDNVNAPWLRAAWAQWRSPVASTPMLTVPVAGMARLPLVVHGFTEVQLPLLTLPTAASSSSNCTTGGSDGGGRPLLSAQLKLSVQLQVDAAWLDNGAESLGLMLGVSAASEVAEESRSAVHDKYSPLTPPSTKAAVTTVHYDDTATALSLNAFTFTPMARQSLFHCADVPVIEMTVPLNLVTKVSAAAATSPSPSNTHTARSKKTGEVGVKESHWTTRVVLTLLWKDVPDIDVPNVSVVDAVVFAHEVVLTKNVPVVTATGELPAAGSTVRGSAVGLSCHAVARVPVRTGQQVIETESLKTGSRKRVSSTMRFLVLFLAFIIGVVGGMMWALWTQERLRPTYMVVQNTDEGQDMQVISKRG